MRRACRHQGAVEFFRDSSLFLGKQDRTHVFIEAWCPAPGCGALRLNFRAHVFDVPRIEWCRPGLGRKLFADWAEAKKGLAKQAADRRDARLKKERVPPKKRKKRTRRKKSRARRPADPLGEWFLT